MIDGAKPEIEGLNHDIDGVKCQVVEYFVKHEIDVVNHKIDEGNHVK